jgi:hypothetical protein
MKFIFIAIFLLLVYNLQAQQIMYTYDAAGNRIQRKVVTLGTENLQYNPAARASNNNAPNNSPTNVINDTIGSFMISAYPNPTKDMLTININELGQYSHASISIMDMQGRNIIVQQHIDKSNIIDFSSYPTGTYYVEIVIDNYKKQIPVVKVSDY